MTPNLPDLKTFCQNLISSKLVTDAEARDLWARAAKEAAGADGFANWLVQQGKLSRYQADSLLRGNKTFFLDDYKLIERVGQGRMAGVFQAVHKLGMPVAVKILPPSRAKDANSLARFQREANLALKLDHPRIVKTYHAGSCAGLHYIAMEYLQGETLEERLERKKKLPIIETLTLASHVLDGLQHMHERNLVHRDLKPANLMLQTLPGQNPDGGNYGVKLLDIGLGRELFDEEGGTPGVDLTAAGTTLGTPNYMAPEQCRNSHLADIRSDLYSLGCVLYECITGQVPFPGKNLVEKLMKHTNEMPTPPDYGSYPYAANLHTVLWRMLAKKQSDRYQVPAEALRDIQGLIQASTKALVAVPAAPVAVVPAPAAPAAPAAPQLVAAPVAVNPIKPAPALEKPLSVPVVELGLRPRTDDHPSMTPLILWVSGAVLAAVLLLTVIAFFLFRR